MSIRVKIFLFALLILVVPITITSLLTVNNAREVTSQILLGNQVEVVEFKVEEIEIKLGEYRRDALIASEYPPIQGIIRSRVDGLDPLDGSTLDLWKTRLISIYSSLVENNLEFTQVRYIDANGDELVRVDSSFGEATVAVEEDLQNKRERYYFEETAKLAKGEIFTSELDLNIENGKIVEPYEPTIRFSTPVFDDDTGDFAGIVIINVNARRMIDLVSSDYYGQLILVDQTGQILSHPNESLLFGELLGTGENYFNYQPELKGNLEKFLDYSYFDNQDGEVRTWKKVPIYKVREEPYWVLISVVDEDLIFHPLNRLLLGSVLVAGGVGLVGLVFSLILSNSILKPISILQKEIEDITEGNWKTRTSVNSNDEIGFLARSFNSALDKLSKETGRMVSVLENTTDSVVVAENDGRIVYANNSFMQLVGISKENVVGSKLGEIFLVDSVPDKDLYVYKKRSGEEVVLQISESPVMAGGAVVGEVSIIRDFSEQYAIQKEKDEFFSIASHELRTPLSVISGNLDMILHSNSDADQNLKDEMLEDSLEASDRLIKIVNDFLSVSTADQGKLAAKLEKIDVCELISKVVDGMRPSFEQKGIEINNRCAGSLMVSADEELLTRSLENMIGNCLKFTKEGGVTVEADEVDNEVVITLSDTGIGISEEGKKYLFKKFQQAMEKRLGRDEGGTGLGLYLTKKYMRLMGGDVYLKESQLGKGSTFEIVLKKA